MDEQATPKEIISPIEDSRKIEELLSWDLDDEALHQLREVRKDRTSDKRDAYLDLDSI